MKKILSLIKASLHENMSLFKFNTKKSSRSSRIILPIFIAFLFMSSVWTYANAFMEPLLEIHLEYVLLSLFTFFISMISIVEGIYKSGNLLFNCKDDDLMFSLPIKKSTVLFVRIFKLYLFELIYTALMMLPVIAVYLRYVTVDYTFYITSIVMILTIPIIPIVISCIIGFLISSFASRFKFKNLTQIVATMAILLIVLYLSFNFQNIITDFGKNATSINDLITKIYYPAGLYSSMATSFRWQNLSLYLLAIIGIFIVTIQILKIFYFRVSSRLKSSATLRTKRVGKIKRHSQVIALMKKEVTKFASSPVFVTNAAFGLVLYIAIIIVLILKFDWLSGMFANMFEGISVDKIVDWMPGILFALIAFTCLMSSITSSMISLEGKTFNILKSLPVSSIKIVKAKVYTAVSIMIPFLLVGDIIMFIRFHFSLLNMLLILLSTLILPFISALIGIIVNLKYPVLDAENDTEVVKQSMSSMIAVMAGMLLSGLTVFATVFTLGIGLPVTLVIVFQLAVYAIMLILLELYLKYKSSDDFEAISV